MYRLYDYLPSGNGYKVRLLSSFLGIKYEYIEVDITKGESRTAEFLGINPNGRTPVLVTPEGPLPESNAILVFLSEGSPFLPDDRWQRAQVMQWLFFEQYSHEPFIATSRYFLKLSGDSGNFREEIKQRRPGGLNALTLMDQHLADRPFMTGDGLTIADIALYAYTHVAPEGGFPLEPYPHIKRWLERIAGQPGYIGIQDRP